MMVPGSLGLLQQRLSSLDVVGALTEDRLHAGQSADLLPDLLCQLLQLLGRGRHLQSQHLVGHRLDNGNVGLFI